MNRICGVFIVALLLSSATGVDAQVRIWKCGNTFTNSADEAQARHCLPMDGRATPAAVKGISGSQRSSPGSVQIARNRDGHFYATGYVNDQPVRFLVDTGASAVSVTDRIADAAGLAAGREVGISTAAGSRAARVTSGDVRMGVLFAPGIEIVRGLTGDGVALLGQSFLRRFNIHISGDTMTIEGR
jgi:clan AA aspartic protease (TIGR02281 family)